MKGIYYPERVPALLSRQPDRRAGAWLRRRRRQRPRRSRRQVRRRNSTACPAKCTPPWTRAAKFSAPASTTPSLAATSFSLSTRTSSSLPSRRSTAPWQRTQAAQRNRRRAGRAHRPDSRSRHSPHLQSQQLSPHHARAAQGPRRQRCLRARLRLQARHLLHRARPARRHARRHDRLPGRPDHPRRPRHPRRQGRSRLGRRHRSPRRSQESSDVAAVKLALKVGPDRFYQYIRDFGFGSRSGIELPGETRGLLQPVKRWGGSSIGSIAIGQEVAVTPIQLVTMVSTIANGGVYLPPHILFPGQIGYSRPNQKPAAPQVPQAVQARRQICPIPCPPARIASSPRSPPPRCAR